MYLGTFLLLVDISRKTILSLDIYVAFCGVCVLDIYEADLRSCLT
jgi:hypothetical protein